LFIGTAVIPFVLSVIFAIVARYTGVSWLFHISIVGLLITYLGALAHPLISIWKLRKPIRKWWEHPFEVLLKNSSDTATVDLRYLPKLESKPLRLLEVTALEVRAEREFLERRIALLVGAVEKVGLAPGLLAAFLSFHKLPSDLNPWITSLAYATPFLYMLAVTAHFSAMRLDRMSKLLELAIAHRKERESTSA